MSHHGHPSVDSSEAMPSEAPPSRVGDPPLKLVAIVLGLAAVICLMLFAFTAPALNSGPAKLPLAVSGPAEATDQLVATLAESGSDTFDVTNYASAEDGADAITSREAIGGIAIDSGGITIQTAAGAGTPYAGVLQGIGTRLEAGGQSVTYDELAPTTEDDPTGSGLGSLGLPLLFGGMAASAALVFAYRGKSWHRFAAVSSLAVVAGLAATAVLQFGFGVVDDNYLLIAAGVTAGILAIAFPVLGLESKIGTAGLGVMAVLLLFLSNPLSGLATGPQWLPDVWGDIGQFLPIGAAGTVVRSAAYFDGAGATTAWIVLACWALAGLAIALAPGFTRRRSDTAHH